MSSHAPAFRLGDRGPAVVEIRRKLVLVGVLDADAEASSEVFGPATERAVRAFQQSRGLSADGVVGPATYRVLDEARWRLGDRLLQHDPSRRMVGDDILALQRRLAELGFDVPRIDGVFGPATEAAVREFQRNLGLPNDGTCGPATFKALVRLTPRVAGSTQNTLRATEALRQAGPQLAGKGVVIDPGHGGPDRGVTAHGLVEAEIVADVAARVEGRLAATGVRVWLTRGRSLDHEVDERSRAVFANATHADLVLSLHCEGIASPHGNGAATFYFGRNEAMASLVGARVASLIQREITARTDLTDCGTHPKTWDLLRYTRMPAIRLELGYLTNPRDAARLGDPVFRDAVAEGLAVAFQRLYLPEETDPETGSLRWTDVVAAG
jgi:N-acetylmuramoyl-L-alanine amidase